MKKSFQPGQKYDLLRTCLYISFVDLRFNIELYIGIIRKILKCKTILCLSFKKPGFSPSTQI